jgi:hypothetical protein
MLLNPCENIVGSFLTLGEDNNHQISGDFVEYSLDEINYKGKHLYQRRH